MSKEEWAKYDKEIESNYKDWSKEVKDAFNKNEKMVATIMENVFNNLNKGKYGNIFENNLQRLLKAF